MNLLDIARGYVRDGLSCFPVRYGGKGPDLTLIPTQLPYYNRMPEAAELETWFGEVQPSGGSDSSAQLRTHENSSPARGVEEAGYENSIRREVVVRRLPCNIAICTGSVSGNLCVLDFDSRELFANWLTFLGGMPKTRMVVTGKGNHVYLRTDVPVRSRKLAGFDLKAEGGYVVAPPSYNSIYHHTYTWQTDTQEIAVVPSRELASGLQEFFNAQGIDFDDTDRSQPGARWITETLENGAAEGARNDTTVRLYGYLGRRLHRDVAQFLTRLWNQHQNTPPLPDHEMDQILNHWHRSYDSGDMEALPAGLTLDEIFGVE